MTTATTATMRRGRGYSLIEVMVAAALFAVGIAAILTAFGSLSGLIEHQRRLGTAALIAQSTVQELQSRPATHADLAAGRHTPLVVDADGRVVGGTIARTDRYRVEWTVRPDVPVTGSREVVVVVVWTEGAGQRSFSLVVYRS